MIYQFRIKGHLDRRWTDWFEGLTITLEENGETLLSGPVADQAALHGLLRKVRDLGMPLLSVIRVKPGRAGESDVKQQTEPSYLDRKKQDDFNQKHRKSCRVLVSIYRYIRSLQHVVCSHRPVSRCDGLVGD